MRETREKRASRQEKGHLRVSRVLLEDQEKKRDYSETCIKRTPSRNVVVSA